MSMQLISEKLLEMEIRKIEEQGITEENECFYSLCRKELAVIERLKIGKIDMRGETEEVKERLEKQGLYFMDVSEFIVLEKKARKYDEICKLIDN